MIPVAVDLETTGLDPLSSEILQCSIVSVRGDVLFNRHFCPQGVSEWPKAEAINHISPASVADCPPFSAAVDEISSILSKTSAILGYNHYTFDLPFLRSSGVHFPSSTLCIDLMRLYAPVFGEYRSDGQYKWQKLSRVAEFNGFPSVVFHDAVIDCFAVIHSFYQFNDGFLFSNGFQRSFFQRLYSFQGDFSSVLVDLPLACEYSSEDGSGVRRFSSYPSSGFPRFTRF